MRLACGGTKFYQDTPYLFQRPRCIQVLILFTSSILLGTSKYNNKHCCDNVDNIRMVLGESISRKTLQHLIRCQETWFGNHCPMRRKTSWKHGRKSVKWRKSRTGCGWSLARGSISGIANHLTNWPTTMGLDGDVISNDVTNPKKKGLIYPLVI